MKRPKVLLVDDEPSIVMGLVRVLYKDNKHYDVLLASDAEVGQTIMREQEISVLLTDLNLPKMSGMELLCWAAAESAETHLIIITALNVEQIRNQAHSLGCLQIFQKPFDLEKIRELIHSLLLRKDNQPSGRLSGLSVADMLQMLCLGKRTTTLHVTSHDHIGMVFIRNGEILHALWPGVEGELAFYKVLQAEHSTFRLIDLPDNLPQTISQDWQFLIMEGMRREDEEKAGISSHKDENDDLWRITPKEGTQQLHSTANAPKHLDHLFSDMIFPESSTLSPPDLSALSFLSPSNAIPSNASPSNASPRHISPHGIPISAPSSTTESSTTTRRTTTHNDSAHDDTHAPFAKIISEKEIALLTDRGFEALRSGDREKAKQLWQEALRYDPENRALQVNLKKLLSQ